MKTYFQFYQMPLIKRVLRYIGMVGQGVDVLPRNPFTLRVTLCMRAKHKNELRFIAYSAFAV